MAPSSSTSRYPTPSDPGAKVADFVHVKLSPTNYTVWRSLMDDFIESQGITMPPPPRETEMNPDFELWKKTDRLLRKWILATLTEDLLLPAVNYKTAGELWTWLEGEFHLRFHVGPHELDLDQVTNNLSYYLPLHIASLNGDWETANKFISDPQQGGAAARDGITGFSETALIVAVRSKQRNHFVQKLLLEMEEVDGKDIVGSTALHAAASAGNVEAAKLLVNKNNNLPYMADGNKLVPLHAAAVLGNWDTVDYLLDITKYNVDPRPFQGERGAKLLCSLAYSGFYGPALKLLRKYPNLASIQPYLLVAMAQKRSAFRSTSNLNFWDDLIYPCVGLPAELESDATHLAGGDIENPANSHISCCAIVKQKFRAGRQKVAEWFGIARSTKSHLIAGAWTTTFSTDRSIHLIAVPRYKHVRDKKLRHHQALELVKCICKEVVKLSYGEASKIFSVPLIHATKSGIHEIVEEIIVSFPGGIHIRNEKKQSIFQLAIVHRREKVFNLTYQLSPCRHIFLSPPDASTNNALHLAGCLATQQELSLRASAAGAALQMQRELQWFKEVQKLVPPQDKEQRNADERTPAEVFTETHKDLVKDGEQWMKSTATSCTIIAALIATGVFAAAINKIPSVSDSSSGGTSSIFRETAFVVFATSDALALVSSVSAILMFLSILTSRYAEDDFLCELPTKLIGGLIALFISIILMMVAFGATLYLVFHDRRVLAHVFGVGLPCIPVTLFVLLQFPLLYVMIKSTYFPGIFGKQSDRVLF